MNQLVLDIIERVSKSKISFCRYIVANETGKTGSHQCGFYIPKEVASSFIGRKGNRGENFTLPVCIKWQNDFETVDTRFKYYGCGTRNEYRLTGFGKDFPMLEEERTGDLLIFIKSQEDTFEAYNLTHDDDIEDFLNAFAIAPDEFNKPIDVNRYSKPISLDLETLIRNVICNYDDFPDSKAMADHAATIYRKLNNLNDSQIIAQADKSLIEWIGIEYSIFKSLENKIYSPVLTKPFTDTQDLVTFANTILNRRKSRAGKSLESHLARIFRLADLRFEEQVVTEDNKKPDFIFPSGEAYHNFLFPTDELYFLGAKTTCKDRWRQVLNEADRIETKYLFTLQQGISKNQLKEMHHEKLNLVVPKPNIKSFPIEYQDELYSLTDFIARVKHTQDNSKSL